MKKIILHTSIIIVSFFAMLYGLNQINWMQLFRIEKISETIENDLGKYIWDFYQEKEIEYHNDSLKNTLEKILKKISSENDDCVNKIDIHIFENSEINAFALPGNNIVVYTGLINYTKTPEELTAVIAHEMAHLNAGHVLDKLIKEFGLSVLCSIASGRNNNLKGMEIIKSLTSCAFDRKKEREADMLAIYYLNQAKINPMGFATFLLRLKNSNSAIVPGWLSTHPDLEERYQYVIQSTDQTISYDSVISEDEWNHLKCL